MKTFEDTIVNEVREIRRQYAERHGYDLDKIVAALQKREQDETDIVQPQPLNLAETNVREKI
ncbi:MAG TPA: hypothetical protein PKO23_13670 [Candidatus Hydrogenedentes bacterium]|nr:hypothetical protein [Candidatus Hydrogenedentota bacterium]